VNDRQVIFHFEEPESRRLDKFLVDCLPEFSRSRLQGLIKEGLVTVDALPARKTGQLLEGGETIRVSIPPPEPSELVPEDIPLDVIFEDQDVLVVNKPAGMVVHPAAGHRSGTLVHAALALAPDIEGVGGVQRPGVVHRLDKDTSGLILMAKNDRAHRWLQRQFGARKVEKTYLALVDGAPPTPRGRIEAPIGRDTRQRQSMTVLSPGKGRAAVTEYYTRQSFPEHTYLDVHPVTGRTHQIRVHLAFLGCPVTGDTIYGRRRPSLPMDRHFLHAFRLTIRLPGEEDITTFEAPLPEELEKLLDELKQRSKL
jgi:23S rRNA pseudouridine1911/1915/1917 synthase